MDSPFVLSVIFCFGVFGQNTGSQLTEVPAPEYFWDQLLQPPLDPLLIDYIALSLEPEQCQTVFAMLTIQDSAQKMHQYVNLSSTKEYASYLKEAHTMLNDASSNVDEFDCVDSLTFWNEKMVGKLPKEKIDQLDFAEVVLSVALSAIERSDLKDWLHMRIQQIKHEDLEELKDEIESHTAYIFPPLNATQNNKYDHRHNSTLATISPKSDSSLGKFITFLTILVFVGLCICGFLITVLTCRSNRDASFFQPKFYNPNGNHQGSTEKSGKSTEKASATNNRAQHNSIFILNENVEDLELRPLLDRTEIV